MASPQLVWFRQDLRTADHPAPERLGLAREELEEILRNYRQSLNLGVEDLARLIGAAEMQAAGWGEAGTARPGEPSAEPPTEQSARG